MRSDQGDAAPAILFPDVHQPKPDAFLQRLADSEQELARLHAVVAEKNAHIQRLERLLERIENGRLMRLLRWAGGK